MRRVRNQFSILSLCLFLLLTVVSFQNCDGGFHYGNGMMTGLSSSGPGSGTVGNDSFQLSVFDSLDMPLSSGVALEGGKDYKFLASGTALDGATLMWAMSKNTGNCVLKSGTSPFARFVTCDKSGAVTVQLTAVLADGSTSVLSVERQTSPLKIDNCSNLLSTQTSFRIIAGTGSSAWNSAVAPKQVYLGQTLRICNDDTINHQLTTGGNGCANQPTPMANGGYYDCKIANTNGLDTNKSFTGWFDTVAGVNARFFVLPLDGRALYADTSKSSKTNESCASCHNAFASSTKKGASYTSIKGAIDTRADMAGFRGKLTDDEIRAMAFALSNL